MKIYKKYTVERYFLVNDTTLSSDNPLRFIKSLLKISIEYNHDY